MGTAKSLFSVLFNCLLILTRTLEIHAMTKVTYDQARNISVEYIGNIIVRQGRMGRHNEL